MSKYQIRELSNHGEQIWWVFYFCPKGVYTDGDIFWNKKQAEAFLQSKS